MARRPNSSILATNSSGVPSFTTTLPFTVPITTGGTGLTSTTAYGVLCGGTVSTSNFQNAGTGTSGQVLTSNGSSALPTWQTPSTGSVTSITAGTGLSGGTITTSGTIAIANTAVTAGTYTIPIITINAQGQITSASSGTAAPTNATYIVQTANSSLTNEQALSSLSTGLLKNTTATGVLTIGVAGTDYYSPGNPTTIKDDGTNLFVGTNAGLSLTTGTNNTGIGDTVLQALTSGSNNTASGHGALYRNTTGARNSAFGSSALTTNDTGTDCTAIGYVSLALNTGNYNSGFGAYSLNSNTTGISNTAAGYNALNNNTTGSSNTGIGRGALATVSTTSNNTAVGANAADSTTGSNNTAVGQIALTTNITGSGNTALGTASGATYGTYTNCLFLGYNADTSANSLTNAISIGYNSTVGLSNAMRLGNGCYVGINQGSPSYALHISNVNSVCALYMNATTNTPSIPASGGLFYITGGEVYYKGNSKTVGLTADTGVTAGTYNFSTITVDAQGKVTAASSGTPVTSITAGTGLSGGTITTSGTIAIANTAVTAGSYTNASITVNAQGQLTAASNGATPAPTNATYIVQTSNATLTNEQALSSLSTGLLKNTTGTGVLTIATAGTDYYVPGDSLPVSTQLLGRCMLSSNDTTRTIANNTWGALSFTTAAALTSYNPSSWYNSANPTRISPSVAGTYRLTGSLRFNNSGGGVTCGIGFGINAATPSNDMQGWFTRDSSTGRRSATYTCIYTTTLGSDYFEMFGQQDSGGSLGLQGFHFQVERLS